MQCLRGKSKSYGQSRPEGIWPANVVVIGGSTGYGLASRIAAGMVFWREDAGNFLEARSRARAYGERGLNIIRSHFNELAKAEGLFAASLNVDAFSMMRNAKPRKSFVVRWAKIDLLYSVAITQARSIPRNGINLFVGYSNRSERHLTARPLTWIPRP